MKIHNNKIKELIEKIGFFPEDGTNNIFIKEYVNHNNYVIKINFNTQKIEYRNCSIAELDGIRWGDLTTSNFENSENFVVLECVNRLLEKGYEPRNIYLEHKFPLGRNEKGKLDILVFDNDNKAYLMIECKTYGSEFIKEKKKMQKDGGQLFSYFIQDKATKYLCLYTSKLSNERIEYCNDVIKVDDEWSELSNQKEIFDHWNKNVKDNGIFEEWSKPYDIESKAIIRGRLQPLTKDDSSKIFNQFAEILRHNVVSDKPNAFNKILNLFICKIIDEDKNSHEQVEFQWLEDDSDEKLQVRLNDLYKKGMHRFLDIDVTDFSEKELADNLTNVNDINAQKIIKEMFLKLRLQKNPEFAFIEVYDDGSFKRNARVVREIVELLQPFQFRYGHKQQFLGDFFELLLNTSIKQEAGQYFTPVPITRYIVSCLPLKEFIMTKIESDNMEILPAVIDFACGTGHFLTEYMDRVQTIIEKEVDLKKAKPQIKKKLEVWKNYDKFDWARDYVYGIDADYRLVKSSKVSSFLNGDGEANIIRANGLDHFLKSKEYKGKLKQSMTYENKDNAQFDVLIANPPYSVSSFKSTIKNGEDSFELFNRLTDNSSEIECLFIERMKQLLKVGGYAGIILPSSILTNTGIYTATREIILKYFKIVAITEFGSNTFMATGTNTVTLFLERRDNTDYKKIQHAINTFFEIPKDVTVLGIEKAFNKYVVNIFEGITIDDYISFVNKVPNSLFKKLDIYKNYRKWFENLTEIKNLKKKKIFKQLSELDKEKELEKIFFEKIFEIEKDKILYFLLTYSQKTVITKVGEKQSEKEFLGYEFSNRRGYEGIKLLKEGTKLYDETCINYDKANSYVYSAFINEYPEVEEILKENISIVNTGDLIKFSGVQFEKIIDLRANIKLEFETRFPMVSIGEMIDFERGITYDKESQVYNETSNVILPADNITLNNTLDIVKKVFLNEEFKPNIKSKLKKDDIFICLSSGSHKHVGKVAYIKEDLPFYAGGFMGILRKKMTSKLDKDIMMEYVYLILSSKLFRNYISEISKGKGSNIRNINEEFIEIKIPLPPKEVQAKIVDKIGIIEARKTNNLDKILSLKKELLNPEYFSFEMEEIGNLTIMDVKRGKSTSYGTSHIQIIKSGQARGYNEFDFSKKYYVKKDFTSDERNLKKGDVLINSSGVGTAGRVTLFNLDGEFVVDSHIAIVRLDQKKIIPKYAMYALAKLGFKTIEKMATGQSGQIELSPATINSLKIPLPLLSEQKEIVAKIEKIEEEIILLENELTNQEEEKEKILTENLV